MKEYVQKYISQGIKVFACKQNKTPATHNGFYDATTDLGILWKQFYKDNFLIGMPTGDVNGIVVIDIDIKDGRTVDELKEAVHELVDLPETFEVETPSGGRHLYYKTKSTQLSSHSEFFAKGLSVDIRANNGYVIVPDGESDYIVYDDVDALEINNLLERCIPLPESIENYKKQYAQGTELLDNILPASEVRELRSALSYLSSDSRDTWIRVGMALKGTGSATAYGLWNEWSKSSPKYNPEDMEKRWAGLKPRGDLNIGSIFHEAQKHGWVTTYEINDSFSVKTTAVDIEEIDKLEVIPSALHQKEPFPSDLLRPGGLVQEIMKYILDHSIKKQPIFALAAGLCAVGALAGRKVQTETGIRTNIYCVCVGESGSGKEAPRKLIKKLFQEAACPEIANVEDIASDSSMITALSKAPSQVFILDEIGRFLKTTSHNIRNSHLYNIVSNLLKLYSSPDQKFYGKIYADDDRRIEIHQPNLCLYGTTVPDTLYKGLHTENVTDGFLSRVLIMETDTPRPRKQRRKNLTSPPPLELIDQIKALYNKPVNLNPRGDLDHKEPNPQIVPLTEQATDFLEDFDDWIENLRDELEKKNKISTLYSRTSQIAEQIALIVAVGKNIDNPVITETEIIYGIRLAKYLADSMLYITENFIAMNEYEHAVKKVLQLIRSAGKIRRTELTRSTQYLQGYIRSGIIETLIESEQIQEFSTGTGPKKTTWYIPVKI